jgi:hypothetical protein
MAGGELEFTLCMRRENERCGHVQRMVAMTRFSRALLRDARRMALFYHGVGVASFSAVKHEKSQREFAVNKACCK